METSLNTQDDASTIQDSINKELDSFFQSGKICNYETSFCRNTAEHGGGLEGSFFKIKVNFKNRDESKLSFTSKISLADKESLSNIKQIIEKGMTAAIIGENNELRMFKFLKKLQYHGEFGIKAVFRGNDYIDNVLKADFVIVMWRIVNNKNDFLKYSQCLTLYLQVKSSTNGQDEHMLDNPYIPSIVTRASENELMIRLETIIKAWSIVCSINTVIESLGYKNENPELKGILEKEKGKYLQRLHQ